MIFSKKQVINIGDFLAPWRGEKGRIHSFCFVALGTNHTSHLFFFSRATDD